MSLDINIGGTSIPTDPSKLKDLKSDASLLFNLESKLEPLLNSPLANVPANATVAAISYGSPAFSWKPGPVKFGLQANAKCSLEIITSGGLIDYTDGLDSPQKKPITLDSTQAYTKLTLNFGISIDASGTYSGGAYGVKAGVENKDTYDITYCKKFDRSTPVRTAIAQTFESFIFPLYDATLNQDKLQPGDYLLHEFDANLHLSFGAYFGFDKAFPAGQSAAAVLAGVNSKWFKFSAPPKPKIDAKVSLDFSYQYEAKFEALLSKPDSGTARLHLFRSNKSMTSIGLKAQMTFDPGLSGPLADCKGKLNKSLVDAVGGKDSPEGKLLAPVLTAADDEIGKQVGEAIDKVTAWTRADGSKLNLQASMEASVERTKSRAILAGYDFNTTVDFRDAWKAAMNGDFVAAMKTGAVTLDVGSGMEQDYQRKTSFSCNFFNLWKFTSWSEFTSKVSMVYAGNNVFHLAAKIDLTTEKEMPGAMHNMDFYFLAAADQAASGQIANPQVDLHIDVTAQNDPKAARLIVNLLTLLQGPTLNDLANAMQSVAARKTATVQLKVTIPSAAYLRLNTQPSDQQNDSKNWSEFARAADQLHAWNLWGDQSGSGLPSLNDQDRAFLKGYPAWVQLNEALCQSNHPDRTNVGNPSIWPESFRPIDSSARQWVIFSMLAGQLFMNFCADLRTLGDAVNTNANAATTTWNRLIAIMTKALQKDSSIDFFRPAALAAIRLCSAGGFSAISGPATGATPLDHFAVAITL